MPGIAIDAEAGLELSFGETDYDRLSGILDKSLQRNNPVQVPVSASNNGQCDGTGKLIDLPVTDKIPMGMRYEIGRVIIWADNHTPANPSGTGYVPIIAGSWWGLWNGPGSNPINLLDFGPQTFEYPASFMFPAFRSYSGHNAIVINGGERLVFSCVNAGANLTLSAITWGWMTTVRNEIP